MQSFVVLRVQAHIKASGQLFVHPDFRRQTRWDWGRPLFYPSIFIPCNNRKEGL
jgi:hypothetical protein